MNNKVRTLFYGIIGVYLVYLSYDLFPARTGMEGAGANWMLAACILFAVSGVIFVVLALRLFKKTFIDGEDENVESNTEESKVEEEPAEEGTVEEKTEEQRVRLRTLAPPKRRICDIFLCFGVRIPAERFCFIGMTFTL